MIGARSRDLAGAGVVCVALVATGPLALYAGVVVIPVVYAVGVPVAHVLRRRPIGRAARAGRLLGLGGVLGVAIGLVPSAVRSFGTAAPDPVVWLWFACVGGLLGCITAALALLGAELLPGRLTPWVAGLGPVALVVRIATTLTVT